VVIGRMLLPWSSPSPRIARAQPTTLVKQADVA
jgi:hypothetical protein